MSKPPNYIAVHASGNTVSVVNQNNSMVHGKLNTPRNEKILSIANTGGNTASITFENTDGSIHLNTYNLDRMSISSVTSMGRADRPNVSNSRQNSTNQHQNSTNQYHESTNQYQESTNQYQGSPGIVSSIIAYAISIIFSIIVCIVGFKFMVIGVKAIFEVPGSGPLGIFAAVTGVIIAGVMVYVPWLLEDNNAWNCANNLIVLIYSFYLSKISMFTLERPHSPTLILTSLDAHNYIVWSIVLLLCFCAASIVKCILTRFICLWFITVGSLSVLYLLNFTIINKCIGIVWHWIAK